MDVIFTFVYIVYEWTHVETHWKKKKVNDKCQYNLDIWAISRKENAKF